MMAIYPKKRISMEELRKHAWILKEHPNPPRSYIPTFEKVTQIDEEVMQDLVAVGFEDSAKSRSWIMKNKNNVQVAAAYQLFLHRRKQTVPPRAISDPSNTRSRSLSSSPEYRPRHNSNDLVSTGIVVQTHNELKNSKQNKYVQFHVFSH
jgi:hypothetical protein